MKRLQLYFLLSLLASYVIYEVYQLQVDPEEYSVSQSLRIDASPVVFFNFITQTHILEKEAASDHGSELHVYWISRMICGFISHFCSVNHAEDRLTITGPVASGMSLNLFPWLTWLREADMRILGTGKVYQAYSKMIIGSEKIHLMVVEYRPGKLLALESQDQLMRQRIVIRTRCYHDGTILSTRVYSRRTSAFFHYTVGQAIQLFIKKRLEQSLSHVGAIYKAVENEIKIPYSILCT